MFNSSLRRVARSYPSAPSIPGRPTTPCCVAASISSKSHQRRHSSSKPPIPPNNGSNPIPPASVKTVGAPRTKDVGEKRLGAESRLSKRKIARGQVEGRQIAESQWTASLPSVPSTQHLSKNDIFLSSFFAIHRPISITSPFPAQISPEEFDKIFTPKPKPSRSRSGPNDVIYTLSSAVETLDENISQQQNPAANDQGVSDRADIITALTQHNNQPQHLDGQPQQPNQLRVPNGVKIVIQEIARRFRPFNVPPPPQEVSEAELEAREAKSSLEAGEDQQARELDQQVWSQDGHTHPQTHPAGMTVHEIVETPYGTFQAVELDRDHPSASEEQEQDFERGSSLNRRRRGIMVQIERRRRRFIVETEDEGQGTMYAISVKRQRKLKMKKHKYKKLMRKTRNLRRRMDKL